jgi:peptidoglycan/xylan/chitin deacetylase (PgdA/CDA1 family)
VDGYDEDSQNPSSAGSRRRVYYAGSEGYVGTGGESRPPRRPPARGLWWLVAALVVVALACAGLATYALMRNDGPAKAGAQGASPQPSVSPSATASSPSPGASGPGTASPSPSWPALATDPRTQPVPILMYHIVAPVAAGATYPGLYVPPSVFQRQMRYLHDQGFQAVTLAQVFGAWRGEGDLPAKPVVLSFDDGYRSDYYNAAPMIGQYGWVGVLSVDWKVIEQDPRLGTMVGLLAKMGWEIDSHSLTHPDLRTLSGTALTDEVAGSRTKLQDAYGVPVDFFCYPSGGLNATVKAAVKNAGYLGATTTIDGVASPQGDSYALPRVRIEGGMSLSDFAAAVR